MVGFSFVQNFGGVLKKARFWVTLVVATALVLLAVLSFSLDDGSVQVGSSIGGNAARVVEDTPLPKLSESTAPSAPNPAPSQTDNSTAPVTSSGAVKASFTVVSRPISDQEEGGTSSTGDVARDPKGTSSTAPAQVVNGVAVDDQPTQNDQLGTAADVRPKSGGLAMGWVLLITAWSVEVAAVCGLAFLRVQAKSSPLETVPSQMH
jgi:hypothetical protein